MDLLSDQENLKQMHWNAYRATRNMLWNNVADEYCRLICNRNSDSRVFLPPLSKKHLERMLDEFGLIQFTSSSKPDLRSGYTIDDNTRALVTYLYLFKLKFIEERELREKTSFFLKIIEKSKQEDGKFLNYFAGNKLASGVNKEWDLEDTQGRIVWSMCELLASNYFVNSNINKRAKSIVDTIVKCLESFSHLRSIAFCLYRLSLLPSNYTAQKKFLAKRLVSSFKKSSIPGWKWFEDSLTYANGILPASLLRYARLSGNSESQGVGIESLGFLCKECFWGDVFVPIGQSKWYKKGKERSLFDQQPEEACHMIFALSEAYKLTKKPLFRKYLRKVFLWFLGNNILGQALYNPKTGGCFDGLTPQGVNRNQGAESLLSYLLSRLIVEEMKI